MVEVVYHGRALLEEEKNFVQNQVAHMVDHLLRAPRRIETELEKVIRVFVV